MKNHFFREFLPRLRSRRQGMSNLASWSATCFLVLSAGDQAMAAAAFSTDIRGPLAQGDAEANVNGLPQAVQTAVINDAADRTGTPASNLNIVEAEQRNWPDGCLGLSEPGTACTQVIVPGWQVVVSNTEQAWVYRTDATGNQVKLAESRSLPGGEQAYTDIGGHWASPCVQRLGQQGVISGYPDSTFRPNTSITRAEYAALLDQAFPDIAPERSDMAFIDVPPSFWGQEAIQAAYQRGFLAGYPNQQFRPNTLISRVEAFVALASGLDYGIPEDPEAVLTATYSDAESIPNYATEPIAAITQRGFVVTELAGSTALNPSEPATRAEMAAALCEIQFADSGIADDYVISPMGLLNNGSNNGNLINLGQTCSNSIAGYTLRYPTGWQTNSGEVVAPCQVFDPTTITLPEQSSSFDEAIRLYVDNIPFEAATSSGDSTATELSRRTKIIDGYEAAVTESETTGHGLLPAGIRTYTYIISLNDEGILVASTYDMEGQQYDRNKRVLDRMVNSIDFIW